MRQPAGTWQAVFASVWRGSNRVVIVQIVYNAIGTFLVTMIERRIWGRIMPDYSHYMNEILGQIYQHEKLQQCISEEVRVHPDRIRILHQVVMNYDCMSSEEIREKAYRYAKLIEEDELAARQIFLCLLRLAEL